MQLPDRPARELPIQMPEPSGVSVIREGLKVFVGDAKGEGMWIEHANAQTAKATERGLKRRLRKGWGKDLDELIVEVGREVTAESDRHLLVKEAETKLRAARAQLREAKKSLRSAELVLRTAKQAVKP